MENATLIVPPNAIADVIGVAMVEITARKMKAKDKGGNVMFSCSRRNADDVTQDFIPLVKMIAERASAAKRARIEKV
jgi:hypothetical protein